MSDPIKVGSVEEVKRACAAVVAEEAAMTTDSPANLKVRIEARIRSLNIVWEPPDEADESIEELRGCKKALFAVGMELQRLGCIFAWDGDAGTASIELPPNSLTAMEERRKFGKIVTDAIDRLLPAPPTVEGKERK